MNNDRTQWRIVAAGLQAKLLALAVAVVVLPIAVSFDDAPKGSAFGVALSAIGLDFVGRCLCLAAPIPRLASIIGSVVCQASGIILMWFIVNQGELARAIEVAVCLQFLAAVFFSNYLGLLARTLERPDLEADLNVLSSTLVKCVVTSGLFPPYALGCCLVFVFICLLGFFFPLLYFLSVPLLCITIILTLVPTVVFFRVFAKCIFSYNSAVINMLAEIKLKNKALAHRAELDADSDSVQADRA